MLKSSRAEPGRCNGAIAFVRCGAMRVSPPSEKVVSNVWCRNPRREMLGSIMNSEYNSGMKNGKSKTAVVPASVGERHFRQQR